MAKDIQQIINQLALFVDERDWDQFHNPKDLAMQISIESAELMEHFLWRDQDEIRTHLAKHKDEIGEELADVLHNVLLMVRKLDIDLLAASERKLAKNRAKYPVHNSKGSHQKYTEK